MLVDTDSNEQIARVTAYNSHGAAVYKSIGSPVDPIDVKALRAGIYLISIGAILLFLYLAALIRDGIPHGIADKFAADLTLSEMSFTQCVSLKPSRCHLSIKSCFWSTEV